jgi:hypothetical protein
MLKPRCGAQTHVGVLTFSKETIYAKRILVKGKKVKRHEKESTIHFCPAVHGRTGGMGRRRFSRHGEHQ